MHLRDRFWTMNNMNCCSKVAFISRRFIINQRQFATRSTGLCRLFSAYSYKEKEENQGNKATAILSHIDEDFNKEDLLRSPRKRSKQNRPLKAPPKLELDGMSQGLADVRQVESRCCYIDESMK